VDTWKRATFTLWFFNIAMGKIPWFIIFYILMQSSALFASLHRFRPEMGQI